MHFPEGGGKVKYRNNGFASARKMLNENFLTTCHGRQAGAAGEQRERKEGGVQGGLRRAFRNMLLAHLANTFVSKSVFIFEIWSLLSSAQRNAT